MPPALPLLDGVEHAEHELPTGVRVHVAALGPATAPPVLAVHGWPQHWWAWRAVAPRLASDHRVLMPDLRGFGWSGFPDDADFTKERLADDVLALLDVLGLERVALLGHDWGAWTAMLAALRAPERFSAVLGDVDRPAVGAHRRGAQERVAARLPAAAGGAVRRRGDRPRRPLRPHGPHAGPARRRGLGPGRGGRVRGRDPHAAGRARELAAVPALPRARGAGLADAGRSAAAGWQVPVRLLHGSRDPLGRELATGIEHHADDGALEIVRGAGHFLPEETPELVADRARALFAP